MTILAIDVDYRDGCAYAAGVLFHDWPSAQATKVFETKIDDVQEYESGQFYRRELPCIMQLLTELSELPKCIVVDGHVYLDEHNKPGLGAHLYDALDQNIIVVGVAKNAFKDTPKSCEVLRGTSLKPLYVTAAGIEQEKAKAFIGLMHGKHRFPTLLQQVDHICRGKD